jgi:hypothetical protein
MVVWLVNGELESIGKEEVVGLIEVVFWNFATVTEEEHGTSE